MRHPGILTLFLFLYFQSPQIMEGQVPSVSGTVNIYTPVVDFGCDSSELIVASSAGFIPGDKVLIIQMKGAVIDTSNTQTFGSILDWGSAGNYEFNRIATINGPNVQLRFSLLRNYDLNGLVQLIKVPEYESLVASDLTCAPWNGITGGVLVLDVKGTLQLNGSIDVSGKGFRGGNYVNAINSPCHYTDYFYPVNPEVASMKGEGIAIINTDKSFGRGKLANGGGGGNAHNGGGGGGGNYYAGGQGGYEYPCAGPLSQLTNGIAGVGLANGYQQNRLFLGGGGGAGQSNDDKGTKGGNGAGIIILIAEQITSQGAVIRANGENILGGNSNNDGQGGGGAGGVIILSTPTINGTLALETTGGRGGNSIFLSQLIGPGGGGSGGLCMIPYQSPGLSISLNGGNHGICGPGAHGAENGEAGLITDLPILPESTIPAPIYNIPLEFDLVDPCGQSSDGSITISPLGLEYSINGSPFQTTPIFSGLPADTFNITIRNQNGCTRDTVVELTSIETKAVFQIIELCKGSSVLIEGQPYDSPQIVTGDTLQSINGCDSVNIYEIVLYPFALQNDTILLCNGVTYNYNNETFLAPTTIIDTLPGIQGCDTLLTITLQPLPYPMIQRTLTLCPGQSVTIGGVRYTAPGIATDTIPGAGDACDSIRTTTLVFEPPAPPFLPADTFLCPGDILRISTPFEPAFWNGQATSNPFELIETGIYIVTGRTPEGCLASDTLRVRSCCDGQNLYVPNVFSPNDDGFNDYFRAYPGSEWCQQYVLRIYDRWGELIYEADTPPLGWDGVFRGREMPGGIYIWVIDIYSEKTARTEVLKGDLLLVR